MTRLNSNRLFYCYFAAASFLMIAIIALQYYRHDIFGTNLFLGWDSPGYVWLASEVLAKGPIHMAHAWNFPQLYTQLLAFFGYLCGNVAMSEKVLPLFFGTLLIFANSKISYRLTSNVHIAGLAGFLTSLSLNFLRLLSDLNRNLMAFSLSMMAFLPVSDFVSSNATDIRSLLNRKFLFVILVCLLVAGTQFETFFILSLSLILLGILSRNLKKLAMLVLAVGIPTVAIQLSFPQFLSGYGGTIEFVPQELAFDQILLWSGGSWLTFCILIVAIAYLAYKALRQRDTISSMIFSWVAVIVSLVVLTVLRIVPLPLEFAFRALLIMPMSLLFASVVSASLNLPKGHLLSFRVFSSSKEKILSFDVRKMCSLGIVLILLASSVVTVGLHCDEYLTPYIPYSGYRKILVAREFLISNGLSKPIVVFYGEPGIWFTSLYKNYLSVEIGEHFGYYGQIENLLLFVPTQPQSSDPSVAEMEKRWSTFYYNELLGNWTGLPPPMYSHESYIDSVEALMSHPILIVTPDFYSGKIPFYITPFYEGREGIYLIPPNSIILSNQTVYGQAATVIRDGTPAEIRSEYLYADPDDPSLIALRVNGSSGYTSYSFLGYPSDWVFMKIEQGGSISLPEKDPHRLNGASAVEGNDLADSATDWSTLQTGTISIDSTSKKEGSASLKVEGITDSWSNLGARYAPSEILDMSLRPLLAVWAKASERATFSMTLCDSTGNKRTFWDIRADGSSTDTQWKRFAINLNNYTSQTPDFDLAKVVFVDFYISSGPGESMSLWLDDLVIDDFPPNDTVFKARVLSTDAVVAYFYSRISP
jgi:hypothetical protein